LDFAPSASSSVCRWSNPENEITHKTMKSLAWRIIPEQTCMPWSNMNALTMPHCKRTDTLSSSIVSMNSGIADNFKIKAVENHSHDDWVVERDTDYQ
jgi:hypothetical protein